MYKGRWRRRWQLQCFALQSLYSFCLFFLFVFFLKHDQFYQGWIAEHSAEHTTKSFTGFWLFGCLMDIVVGGAVALVTRFRTRRRGKRAGALVKLCQRGFKTPLPSIHLANLRSLPNKTAKLLLLSRTNKDFFKLCCSVFHGNQSFTETTFFQSVKK